MLIERWEKLRGYDKWIEAAATIESSKVRETAHNGRDGSVSYSYDSGDQLIWVDVQGIKHSAQFRVDDESPLYQLVGGETVEIRYNPARPESYYFRALLQSRVRRFFRLTLIAGIVFAVLAALIVLNIFTHKR